MPATVPAKGPEGGRRIIYNVYPDWPLEKIRETVQMAPRAAMGEPGTPVVLRYAEGEYDLGGVLLIAGPDGCEVIYECYGSGKLSESWNGTPAS